MLKRNAFLRILLVAILAIVFLLIIGKSVLAAETTTPDHWVVKIGDSENTGYVDDSINLIDDEVGDWVKGRSFSIDWKLTVLEVDDGSAGKASLELTNLSSLKGTLQIPNKITIVRRGLTGTYVYNVTEIKGEYAKSIDTIKLNSNLRNINGEFFRDCEKLAKIEVASGNTAFYTENGILYKKDGNNKILVKVPVGTEFSNISISDDVTKISDYAFAYTSLKEIDARNVKELGDGVFAYCKELNKVVLSDELTKIPWGLFYNCNKLTNVNIPQNITAIEGVSFYKTGISHIEIPEKVISLGEAAFFECPNLVSVVAHAGLTQVGEEIFCDEDMEINNNLVIYTTVNSKIISEAPAYIVYEKAPAEGTKDHVVLNSFKDVKGKVTEINLLNKIYGLPVTVIGKEAFKGNEKLTKIKMPETITDIGESAFAGCKGLTEMILPKALKNIGDSAFSDCTGLKSIIIQKGTELESIGKDAFKNFNGKIYYDGSEESVIDKYAKDNNITLLVDTTAPSASRGIEKVPGKYYVVLKITNMTDDASGVYKYAISTKADPKTIADDEWELIVEDIITKEIRENGTIYFHIMDKVGNIKTYDIIITGVDTTKPEINDITVEGGKFAKVIANVSDNESGLDSYSIQISNSIDSENAQWTTINATKLTHTLEVTMKDIGTWYLFIKDKAGNISEPKTIVLQSKDVDNKAPVVNVSSYEALRNIEKNIVYAEKVEYTITDSGIGLAAYAIDTNENTDEKTRWISIDGEVSSYTCVHTFVANNTYYIHAKDIYGNICNTEYTEDKIEGDLLAPEVKFGNRKDDKIEVIITDLYSGIASGANIGYAWSTNNSEEPSSWTTAELTYKSGEKEVVFNVDGNSLTGEYYIWINIATLKDVEGNENKQGKVVSESYIFDNTAPKIEDVQFDKVAIQEGVEATYTIITTEEVTLNKDVKVTVEDAEMGTLGELTGNGTTWTIKFTAGSKDGDVKLNIPKEVFKDGAGNVLDKPYEIYVVRVDNTNPEMSVPVLSRAKVANNVEATYTFETEEVTIDESKKANVTLVGNGLTGKVEEISSSNNTTWIVTVKGGEGNGEVTLNLPKGLFIDKAGNESNAQAIIGLSFDNVLPTATIEGPDVTLMSKEGTAIFTMQASEKVVLVNGKNAELVGIGVADVIENATIEITNKSEDGKTFEIKVSNVLGNGQSKLVIPQGTFTDEAGNEIALIEKAGLRIDNVPPTIISVSEPELSEDEKSASFIITTEEKEYQYVVSANETLDKITEEWKPVAATTIKATVKSNGNFYVYVKDEIGNITRYENAITVAGVIDDIAPTIKIEAPIPSVIKAGQTATYKIITSEAVTKVDGFDAIVTGEENHVDLTGDKTNWVATVTAGSVDGEVELTLPKGIFKDTSNNSLVNDVKKAGLTIDNTIPEVTVKYEQKENGIKVIVIADEKLCELEGWTLTKTNKDNDTLTKEVSDNLDGIVIKDIAGNEIALMLNIKFAESINIAATETVYINQIKKLSLSTTPTDVIPETIKWTSSDPSKVTVDKDGKIKGIAAGKAIITAVSVIDSNIKGTCEVTVSDKVYVPLKGISFEKATSEIAEGYEDTLKVVFTPSNATNKNITFTSSDPSVAIVDENGKVTALSIGTTTITATFVENEIAGFASCEVTVIEAVPVTSIDFDATSLELNAGESKTLTVTVNPSNATNKKVTWSSTNEKVATVNNNGKVTAIAGGTATIIATSVENDGVEARCVVNVSESISVQSVSLSQNNVDINKNNDIILVATVNPSNATNKKVTWSSDDETVATVVETEPGYAKVTGLKEGTATITVTTEDGNKTDKCIVTVISGAQKATGFKADSNYEMKIVDGVTYLIGIEPKTTINDILAKVEEGYTAKVQDSEGTEITDSTKFVATDKIRIVVTKGTETITYIAVVKGDSTGDGEVKALDLIDAVRQYKYVKSKGTKGKNLTGAKLLAIKFTETEEYTARDLIGEVRMYKQWKNK